jgi:hypothetical protein
METNLRAILIKGRFDERDWTDLIGVLRTINNRHPDEDYHATIVDSAVDPTDPEIREFLKRTYPTRPGHELDVIFKPRKGK